MKGLCENSLPFCGIFFQNLLQGVHRFQMEWNTVLRALNSINDEKLREIVMSRVSQTLRQKKSRPICLILLKITASL